MYERSDLSGSGGGIAQQRDSQTVLWVSRGVVSDVGIRRTHAKGAEFYLFFYDRASIFLDMAAK